MTVTTYATARVGEAGLTALRGKVDELNKRATRHGMNKLELRVVRTVAFFPVSKGRIGCAMDLHDIEINGRAPRIDGWKLAARIEFNDTIGNVVRIAPGTEDDGSFATYRNVGAVCEHCNTNRRRNDIFVLEHEDGRRKLVGRNCLADFLRCNGADAFAKLAEYADLAAEWTDRAEAGDSDYFGGGWAVKTMPLDRYLSIVRMLMRRVGWTSRTAAKESMDDSSTADDAYRWLFATDRYTRAWKDREDLHTCDDDENEAVRAIAWACELDTSGNEYLSVINRIARSGVVDFDGLDGYAASIIIAYRKACEREAERAERAKNAKTKVWLGRAKERVRNLPVTCKGLHSFEGYYGVTTIVRFEHSVSDTEKAVLVWFASGDKYDDWEVDAEYTIDATIKGHDDHETYGKQTKINRVKSVQTA